MSKSAAPFVARSSVLLSQLSDGLGEHADPEQFLRKIAAEVKSTVAACTRHAKEALAQHQANIKAGLDGVLEEQAIELARFLPRRIFQQRGTFLARSSHAPHS